MHPQVWKCSGHYDLFHDFMVDCRESKRRYRHDQVRGRWVEAKGQRIFVATQEGGEPGLADTEQRALKFFNLRAKNADELAWQGPLVSLTTVDRFRPGAGSRGQDAGHAHPAARIQPDVQDLRRRAERRRGGRLPAARNGPGHLRQLQERARQLPGPRAVRHRPDGQELPQRDHAPQLHLPLARVRADGDRILLPSQVVARVVPILARPAFQVVSGPGAGRRSAATARARPGRTEPLFLRHGRHRIRLSFSAAGRIRRAGGDRPSRRLRPAQPHGRQAGAAGQ